MSPATRTERPAQAAYRRHVLYECQSLRDEQCNQCRELAADASAESGQGPRGFAPDAREWRPEAW